MSRTPSVPCNVERFDKGMDRPVFGVSLNEEASARKGNATKTRAVGRYMSTGNELGGPQRKKWRLGLEAIKYI